MATDVQKSALLVASLDPSGYEAGAQRIKQSTTDMNEVVARFSTTTSDADKVTRLSADGFANWLQRIDPATRAGQQYAQALDQLDRFQKAGLVSAGDLAIAEDALRVKFEGAKQSAQGAADIMGVLTGAAGALGVAFGIQQIVQFGKELLDSTAALNDQAQIVGVSTDALQAYRAAAIEAGSSQDVADESLRRLTKSMGDALAGSKQQVQAFQELGVSGSDLYRGSDAVLPEVADALLKIESASQRARLETELFGRSGQQIESVLEAWSGSTDDLIDRMKAMNLVIDHDTIEAADKAEARLTIMWTQVKNVIVLATDAALQFASTIAGPTADQLSKLKLGQAASEAETTSRYAKNWPAGWPISLYPRANDLSSQFADAINAPDIRAVSDSRYEAEQKATRAGVGGDFAGYDDDTLKALTEFHQQAEAAWDKYYDDLAKKNQAWLDRLEEAQTNAEAQIGVGDKATTDFGNKVSKDVTAGIDAAARNIKGDLNRQGAQTQTLNDLREEVQLAGMLPQEREEELTLLRLKDKYGTDFINQNEEEIRQLIEQKQRQQEISDTLQHMQGDFANWLKTVETTGKVSWSNLFNSIYGDFLDMLNKMLAEQAFKELFGGGLGSSGGSSGGGLGSLISLIGGSIGGTSTAGLTYGNFDFGFAAEGGPASGPTIVGENGPELVNFATPAYVTPNSQLGGGNNITINQSINASGTDASSAQRILAAAKQGALDALSQAAPLIMAGAFRGVSTRLHNTGKGTL